MQIDSRVSFSHLSHCHPDDMHDDLPLPYYECLHRYEAFLFQRNLESYGPALCHLSISTVKFIDLCTNPQTRPGPSTGNIPWDEILEPYSFNNIFYGQTSTEVLRNACPPGSYTNYWISYISPLPQCVQQIQQLIQCFETFFQLLRFDSLHEVDEYINLNTEIDFFLNFLLSKEQAKYFRALYDFLL